MERITLANEAGGIGIWEWELSRIFLAGISGCSSCMKFLHNQTELAGVVRVRAAGRSPACEKVIRDSLQSRSPFKLEFRIP